MTRWRPTHYPGFEVSNDGRVRGPEGELTTFCTQKIVKVCIRTETGGHVESVARLMLTAFVREPLPGEPARHKDDIPERNLLRNLRWGTRKQNAADALRNGRYRRGSENGRARFTEAQVRKIHSLPIKGSRSRHMRELAKRFDVHPHTIANILSGEFWKHVK
jgi:hypothetical protein